MSILKDRWLYILGCTFIMWGITTQLTLIEDIRIIIGITMIYKSGKQNYMK